MAPREKTPAPTPAEEASDIGGDVNPYPVDQFAKAREDAKDQPEKVGSPLTAPLEDEGTEA